MAAALLGALPWSSSWSGSFQLPRGAPKPPAGGPEARRAAHAVPALTATVAPQLSHSGFIPKSFLSAVCSHWCPQHGNILCMSCLGLGLGIPMEAGLAVPKHTWPSAATPPLTQQHTGEIKDIFNKSITEGPRTGVSGQAALMCAGLSLSFPGQPQAVQAETRGADQAAGWDLQLHSPAEEAAEGAVPVPQKVSQCL